MKTPISAFITILRAAFLSRTTLALENAALRRQLTIYQVTSSSSARIMFSKSSENMSAITPVLGRRRRFTQFPIRTRN
jgi:hypothetical protein